jgi:rifampicin phosphotransferase
VWAVGEELARPKARNDGTGDLVGTGVSPGTYRGPARIIRTEAELSRLEPGDVLVCPTTHSSWAAVFAHAGALVCDGGGMLSHPSIIAREHGVPAVVGTGNATTLLEDGELITVDGGIVRR